MRKTTSIFIFVSIALLLFWAGCSNREQENDHPVKVRVQKVMILDGKDNFSYSGTIEESQSIPLSFSVTGTISSIRVSEGDFVKKGQLLASLDDTTLKNVCDMSQASLEKAQDAYNRLKPMYKDGNLPEIKFVEVETGLQQAKAAAAIAQKNLDDCKLYAPANGFVGSRSIDPGMNVLPGLTAIKIVDIEKVYAKVSISENEIAQIIKGKKALITIGALGAREFDGTVEEIGVMADPIAHTYKIKIGIKNEDNAIKPGMICKARILTSEAQSSLIAPNQAVQVDELGKAFVFSVDKNQGRAVRKYVEIGRLLNDGIEIKRGLTQGELVVIAGQQKLIDNSPVQIVDQ